MPAYSPFLNPVKIAFSSIKAQVKRELNKRIPQILNRQAAANAAVTFIAWRTGILQDIVLSVVNAGIAVSEKKVKIGIDILLPYAPRYSNVIYKLMNKVSFNELHFSFNKVTFCLPFALFVITMNDKHLFAFNTYMLTLWVIETYKHLFALACKSSVLTTTPQEYANTVR